MLIISAYVFAYTVLFCVPFVVAYKVRKKSIGVFGFAKGVVFSTLIMSVIGIALWFGYSIYLEILISPLDRNGDGLWTPEEETTWTEQDRKNMDTFFGDGGRNIFAVFIFPILSLLFSFSIMTLYWLMHFIKSKLSNYQKPV
ncbi:hypothetical protein [Marinomonas sp. PE14-40]|uniref:hypothetical protein n=1 Tax=Marinomonas sp. PE14-40 TaxID=3060621 RepID=UPI003F666ADA